MNIELGIKSDPIEYRYSYEWLFDLLNECGIRNIQLGSFFELYHVDLEYFHRLREKAQRSGLRFTSCFTSHRELGGFFTGDRHLVHVARRAYERYIEVASVLGADYMGSNPGAVYRDRMQDKQQGIDTYIINMKELMHLACEKGLKGLTIEAMSCTAEPPTTPEETDHMLGQLRTYHRETDGTVNAYICGDISHGFADRDGNQVFSNIDLFCSQVPYMIEFHLKNTDEIYNSTFGFTDTEIAKGIVDLSEVRSLVYEHEGSWPSDDIIAYLEIGGPKTGRDYSDYQLGDLIRGSFKNLKKVFAQD